MKYIGVTQQVKEDERSQTTYDFLDQQWSSYLSNLGFIPIIIPNFKACQDLDRYLAAVKLDGLILSGGNDLAVTNSRSVSVLRDQVEKRLISFALTQNIPLLGVCRGMQILNVYFGGTIQTVDEHVKKNHTVTFKSEESGEVNSYHNWGIKDVNLAEDMEVLARSDDGVAECVGHNEYQVLGIMWHPERFNKAQYMTDQLIMGFLS